MIPVSNESPILARILDLMRERKVTAKKVTNDLHLSGSSFTDWKKGRANPRADTLAKLAGYFDVSLDWLITGKEHVGRGDAENGDTSAGMPAGIGDYDLISGIYRLPRDDQRKVAIYLAGLLSASATGEGAMKIAIYMAGLLSASVTGEVAGPTMPTEQGRAQDV